MLVWGWRQPFAIGNLEVTRKVLMLEDKIEGFIRDRIKRGVPRKQSR